MTTYKLFNLADYGDSVIVTDKNIARLYNIDGRFGSKVYLLPQGEAAKSFCHVQDLCQYFLINGIDRSDKVVAIGGGSIGDTVAFACSIYKRGGIRLTHVPTTLLAQIDSSIGGKTALDIDAVKNAVGTYYSADTVIDIGFLKTLDKLQLQSGLGELFKYRMLSKKVDELYNGEVTQDLIKACVDYKQKICEVDPFDAHLRKILNFGHTLGHAMEITNNITHGHAVANGIYYETTLAYRLGKCTKAYYDFWTSDIAKNFEILPIDSAVRMARYDKKNDSRGVCFILPSDFEETYLTIKQVEDLLC